MIRSTDIKRLVSGFGLFSLCLCHCCCVVVAFNCVFCPIHVTLRIHHQTTRLPLVTSNVRAHPCSYKIDTFPFTETPHAFVEPQILAADDPQIAHNASADVQSSISRRYATRTRHPLPLVNLPPVCTSPESEGFRLYIGSLRFPSYVLLSLSFSMFCSPFQTYLFPFRLIPLTLPRRFLPSSSSRSTSHTSHLFSKFSPLRTSLVLLYRRAYLSPARHLMLIFSFHAFSAPPILTSSCSHWL